MRSSHIINLAQALLENLESEYSTYAGGSRQVITTAVTINKDHEITAGGNCLVAVLWDPVAQVFVASTIPRGSRARDMANRAPVAARTWYSRVAYLFDLVKNKDYATPNFHAEDGTYFLWESSPASHGRIVNNAYTGGLVIGVYGASLYMETHAGGDPTLSKTFKNPDQWSLCAGDGRTPNCNRVAGMLQVTQATRVR